MKFLDIFKLIKEAGPEYSKETEQISASDRKKIYNTAFQIANIYKSKKNKIEAEEYLDNALDKIRSSYGDLAPEIESKVRQLISRYVQDESDLVSNVEDELALVSNQIETAKKIVDAYRQHVSESRSSNKTPLNMEDFIVKYYIDVLKTEVDPKVKEIFKKTIELKHPELYLGVSKASEDKLKEQLNREKYILSNPYQFQTYVASPTELEKDINSTYDAYKDSVAEKEDLSKSITINPSQFIKSQYKNIPNVYIGKDDELDILNDIVSKLVENKKRVGSTETDTYEENPITVDKKNKKAQLNPYITVSRENVEETNEIITEAVEDIVINYKDLIKIGADVISKKLSKDYPQYTSEFINKVSNVYAHLMFYEALNVNKTIKYTEEKEKGKTTGITGEIPINTHDYMACVSYVVKKNMAQGKPGFISKKFLEKLDSNPMTVFSLEVLTNPTFKGVIKDILKSRQGGPDFDPKDYLSQTKESYYPLKQFKKMFDYIVEADITMPGKGVRSRDVFSEVIPSDNIRKPTSSDAVAKLAMKQMLHYQGDEVYMSTAIVALDIYLRYYYAKKIDSSVTLSSYGPTNIDEMDADNIIFWAKEILSDPRFIKLDPNITADKKEGIKDEEKEQKNARTSVEALNYGLYTRLAPPGQSKAGPRKGVDPEYGGIKSGQVYPRYGHSEYFYNLRDSYAKYSNDFVMQRKENTNQLENIYLIASAIVPYAQYIDQKTKEYDIVEAEASFNEIFKLYNEKGSNLKSEHKYEPSNVRYGNIRLKESKDRSPINLKLLTVTKTQFLKPEQKQTSIKKAYESSRYYYLFEDKEHNLFLYNSFDNNEQLYPKDKYKSYEIQVIENTKMYELTTEVTEKGKLYHKVTDNPIAITRINLYSSLGEEATITAKCIDVKSNIRYGKREGNKFIPSTRQGSKDEAPAFSPPFKIYYFKSNDDKIYGWVEDESELNSGAMMSPIIGENYIITGIIDNTVPLVKQPIAQITKTPKINKKGKTLKAQTKLIISVPKLDYIFLQVTNTEKAKNEPELVNASYNNTFDKLYQNLFEHIT